MTARLNEKCSRAAWNILYWKAKTQQRLMWLCQKDTEDNLEGLPLTEDGTI